MPERELEDLVRRYALAGVEEWQRSKPLGARRLAALLLGAQIADWKGHVKQAVGKRRTGASPYLLPARELTADNVEWAFFKPRQDAEEAQWMFDVVFWLKDERHICFRLEPADEADNARHGYSHVQLSWRFNGKQSVPKRPLKWLPASYPAFPVPGKCSADRFLMLLAALHGFPACTKAVLEGLWVGRPIRGREYVERVRDLLGPA